MVVDRIVLRAAAASFAIMAVAGWFWADAYRTPWSDSFELLVLAALLLGTALMPAEARNSRMLAIAVLAVAAATFGWWSFVVAPMPRGNYDIPGFVLRLLAYGCVVGLAFPWKGSARS